MQALTAAQFTVVGQSPLDAVAVSCSAYVAMLQKMPLLLWGPFFVRAPVRPNMLNIPKCAAVSMTHTLQVSSRYISHVGLVIMLCDFSLCSQCEIVCMAQKVNFYNDTAV